MENPSCIPSFLLRSGLVELEHSSTPSLRFLASFGRDDWLPELWSLLLLKTWESLFVSLTPPRLEIITGLSNACSKHSQRQTSLQRPLLLWPQDGLCVEVPMNAPFIRVTLKYTFDYTGQKCPLHKLSSWLPVVEAFSTVGNQKFLFPATNKQTEFTVFSTSAPSIGGHLKHVTLFLNK